MTDMASPVAAVQMETLMMTIFKTLPEGLTVVDQIMPGSWVHVVDPDPTEIDRLQEECGIPDTFITASLDVDALARIDKEQDMMLITYLMPHVYSDDANEVPYSTTPLGIILTTECVFTISKIPPPFLSDLTKRHAKELATAKRHRLVLLLFLAIAQSYLSYLRQLENQMDAIQRKLQISLQNKELLELLRYQKSLTYFLTSLESNDLMMNRLQRNHLFEMYPDDLNLLEDVLTANAQASNMTKIASDISGQMMDAYTSIISNNVNTVMKILAVATIILSIPTVMASIYGMNVPLPAQESGWAFGGIIGVSLVIAVLVGVLFWKRHWL
jgi:magnesium transporter